MQESFSAVYPEQQKPVSSAPQTAGSVRVSSRHFAKLEKFLGSIVEPHPEHESPFVVWVAGELGVGKSTLIRQVRDRVSEREVIFVESRAYPRTCEILEPMLVMARSLIELARTHAESQAPGWAEVWDHIVTRHAPALERVLPEVNWGRAVEPYPDLDPEYERGRLLDHLGGLFLRVAEQVPTILHIDQAENLDPLGIELLETLAGVLRARSKGRRAQLPLPERPRLAVVLCTEREDRFPLQLPESELLPLVMRGLGRDDFARVLRNQYGDEIPLSIREKIYQLTGGNPLDLESRILRERRQEDRGEPIERAKRLLEFGRYETEVVNEVKSALTEEKNILQALAILEKPTSQAILEQVSGVSERRLVYLLAQLEDKAWLERLPSGAVALCHERARRLLEGMISPRDRLELHGRAAEAVQAEYERRPHRRFQEVYYHKSRAPRDEHTVDTGFAAADEAFRLCDYPAAVRIYGDLLDMIDDNEPNLVARGLTRFADLMADGGMGSEKDLALLEDRIDALSDQLGAEQVAGLWRRLGAVAGKRELRDKELAFYRRGFDALQGTEKSSERMLLFASVASSYLGRRHYEQTLHYCQQGMEVSGLDELMSDPEFLEICRVTEEVHFHRGEFVEAIEFERKFLDLARVQGTPQQIFDSLLRLAFLYEHRSDHDQARGCLQEAVPVAQSTGSRLLEARIDERLGYLQARQERWEDATVAFQDAFEAQAELCNEERTTRILGALGMVALFRGDPVAGAHQFRLHALYLGLRDRKELPPHLPGFPCDYRTRSERDEEVRLRMETIGKTGKIPSRTLVAALSELADLRRDRGEFQTARALLRRGLRMATAEGLEVSGFHLQLGILNQMQGEVEPALDCVQKGLDALATKPDRERIAGSNVQVGLLYRDRGRFGPALKFLMRGLRSYLELEHETGVTHALIELAEVYRRLGLLEAAEELGLAALALADCLRVERLEAEAWLLLAAVRSGGDGQTPGHQEVGLARELFGKLGILEGRCRTLLVEAEIFLRWGDSGRAVSLCNEALEIARDLGLRSLTALGLTLRGAIEGNPRQRGDFLRALKTLESALDHAVEVGSVTLQLRIHATMADLFHRRKRPGVARYHLEAVQGRLEVLFEDCPEVHQESLVRSCPCSALLRIYEFDTQENETTSTL